MARGVHFYPYMEPYTKLYYIIYVHFFIVRHFIAPSYKKQGNPEIGLTTCTNE